MGITSPHHRSRTEDSPQTVISSIVLAAAVGFVALVVFASGVLASSFVDEYAYISQSFYTDLVLDGRFHDPLWLEMSAYDLQPVPKYMIGVALQSAGLAVPAPASAAEWYRNYSPYGNPRTLITARIPFVLLGALGCVAIFACGALLKSRLVGVIAAVLLMLDPLYRLLAHRAMSDVPCEAFTLAALALALWVGQRIWCGRFGISVAAAAAVAGICAGLSLLCKFNGFLGLLIISAWCAAAWLAPGLPWRRKQALAAATVASIAVALAALVGLNPFMTARPQGFLPNPEARELSSQGPMQRFLFQVEHRQRTSRSQQQNMPHNALHTLAERAKVLLIQGFGRFGPLGPSESDSTIRSDRRQDWGMIVWMPIVVLGLFEAVRLGRAELKAGEPPLALALVTWAVLSWIVVACYLPMAWDRYLLPIQSASALLAALVASAIWERLAGRIRAPGTGS